MTPHTIATPQSKEQRDPETMAGDLGDVLAERHNIPTVVHVVQSGAALVALYTGLVARCDGESVLWLIPDPDREQQRPRRTIAWNVDDAAHRLASHYLQLVSRPLGELLDSGLKLSWSVACLAERPTDCVSPQ